MQTGSKDGMVTMEKYKEVLKEKNRIDYECYGVYYFS